MGEVAVGIDAGGTATRAIAVTASGDVVGRGEAGGGNPNSHPPAVAAANIGTAVAAALGTHTALTCVLGMAGASAMSDPAVAEVFRAALADAGVERADVMTDAEVAFAAGTPEPEGTVLIAGTGSIAMRIENHRHAATVGGFGWLLGDEGSAFWLGREAVRATVREIQAAGPLGPLASAVLALAVGPTDAPFNHLIRSVNADPPIHLARFAPLVSAHANDPAAAEIIDHAARVLADQALAAWSSGPIVLVGTVAGGDTPVGARLREMLADHEVRTAKDGVAGAAWLAAREAFGPMAPHPSNARVP
ncbi:N-acetylglucosamine kinase of eukaryotic type [Alloactinosynnema sp. L-07]|uniref:N-acetylglucosamine kinase n=1 Tax=Alloactinosynnema sp. L-07 TaxID=1653480 RepID=UPI00065EFE98|nr:BadF/BadG/BcrA/BcrD ATPase family protein [Alloactinosynnema sp. L-07]CRK61230.1 N-acetylglucosamine kinase of eukaryotic type [Alloactinosynnema sp. L-07]